MDKFTRNYSIGLALFCLFILFSYWIAGYDPRVSELNELLENDKILAEYPYQFHVISLKDNVAKLGTPRSFEAPAVKFLAMIYPALKNKTTEDPQLVIAQQKLANIQMHAKELILNQPDITEIHWELDREWYAKRGINFR